MEKLKEDAVNKFKQLLKHKKEMEERAEEIFRMNGLAADSEQAQGQYQLHSRYALGFLQ